ncbi:MAG TPA: hypothetical protein VN706_02310 [Gemmatimonadaceae bacterium]|nr:hypothetical protein [Gemmatimonadaceae bacterium]
MRRSIHLAVVCLIAAAVTPLRAQSGAFTLMSDTSSARADSVNVALAPRVPQVVTPRTAEDRVAGGSLTGMRAGVHRQETVRPLIPNAAATNPHLGQSRAMMVVGAAALIAGAIIGGDPGTIIMVGGAVIGLYGLYQYLQ